MTSLETQKTHRRRRHHRRVVEHPARLPGTGVPTHVADAAHAAATAERPTVRTAAAADTACAATRRGRDPRGTGTGPCEAKTGRPQPGTAGLHLLRGTRCDCNRHALSQQCQRVATGMSSTPRGSGSADGAGPSSAFPRKPSMPPSKQVKPAEELTPAEKPTLTPYSPDEAEALAN